MLRDGLFLRQKIPQQIEIDAATAVAKVASGRGRHIILARYLTEVVPIELHRSFERNTHKE